MKSLINSQNIPLIAMPRFSAKAKEILVEIWYHANITEANKLLEELKDPLDIAFGKLFIAGHYFASKQLDETLEILTEIENDKELFKDQLIQFWIDLRYYWLYAGINEPIVSKEQTEKYLDKMEQSCQITDYQDDWEKYYCLARYYNAKAYYEWKAKDNLSNAIKNQKKCIEAWSKIPEDREFALASGHNNLGEYYRMSGNFEEAEKSYNRKLGLLKEYNNLDKLTVLGSLSELNYDKGELQKAKVLNIQGLDVAKQLNSTYGFFYSFDRKGFYSYQEGNYDEAIKAYQESLLYRKQHGEPLQIFMGYFQIFEFYYQRFKVDKDKAFLAKAEQTLTNLQELSKTHIDNKTIVNYTDYAQALIYKFGNIRKKGKAIDKIEELVEVYPNEIGMSLELLELFFEDVLLTEDSDTIDQIDLLMGKVNKIPLRNNPQAIFHFISQQIILAKYIYYIKGDVSVALNILHSVTEHVKSFKLINLEKILDAEIQVLEKEIKKWENVDMSIKERIKTSEFNKYVQQALIIADQQL